MTRSINSTFNTIGRVPAPRPLIKPTSPKDVKIETHEIVKLLDKSNVRPKHPTEGSPPLPDSKLAQLKKQIYEAELAEIDEVEGFKGHDEENGKERESTDRNSDDDIELRELPPIKEFQLRPDKSQSKPDKLLKKVPEITVTQMSRNPPKWTIQVGAYNNARQAYKRTQKIIERYRLPGKTLVVRTKVKKKNLYQSRIKHLTKSQAKAACRDMKTKKEGCIVLPPK